MSGSTRCYVCKRKLTLVEQTAGVCKCKQIFCAKHRCVQTQHTTNGHCHSCSFDYLAEQRDLLNKQNPLVKFDKLNRF